MSWRQFLKSSPEVLRVKRVESPLYEPLSTLKTLKTQQVEVEKISDIGMPRYSEMVFVDLGPEWQYHLCVAHAYLNGWRGCCPINLDHCLVSRIIDSCGRLECLYGMDLGHGIISDQVIDEWLASGEPAADLIGSPLWFLAMAELRFLAA